MEPWLTPGVVTALTLALVAAGTARGQPVTITRIADTASPTFSSFGSVGDSPAINASGRVAFFATRDAGGSGIYAGNGGPATTIADTDNSTFSGFLCAPAINAGGMVAFRGLWPGGGAGVYAGNGATTTTIADTATSPFTTFGFSPSINAGGVVAFRASQPLAQGVLSSINTGSGGATTRIAFTSGGGMMFQSFGDPTINAGGTVAFESSRPGVGQGVFAGNGGPITTIADASIPPFGSDFRGAAVNDGGTVAFLATRDAGGSGIYTGNGGPATTVADTDSPTFSGFINAPAINAGGVVAFLATLDAGGSGLFVASGGFITPVIATGATLDGSTVTNLSFDRLGLSDSGQLAFFADLADGRQGVYVTTPIPEPASLLSAGGAGLAWAGSRWRRRSSRTSP